MSRSLSDPSSRSIQSSLKLTRDKKKNPRVSDTSEELDSRGNETTWQAYCRDEHNKVLKWKLTRRQLVC